MNTFKLAPEAVFIDIEVNAEGSIAVAGILSRRWIRSFFHPLLFPKNRIQRLL